MRKKDSGCFNSTDVIANFGENGRAVFGRELNQLTAFNTTHFLTVMKHGWNGSCLWPHNCSRFTTRRKRSGIDDGMMMRMLMSGAALIEFWGWLITWRFSGNTSSHFVLGELRWGQIVIVEGTVGLVKDAEILVIKKNKKNLIFARSTLKIGHWSLFSGMEEALKCQAKMCVLLFLKSKTCFFS